MGLLNAPPQRTVFTVCWICWFALGWGGYANGRGLPFYSLNDLLSRAGSVNAPPQETVFTGCWICWFALGWGGYANGRGLPFYSLNDLLVRAGLGWLRQRQGTAVLQLGLLFYRPLSTILAKHLRVLLLTWCSMPSASTAAVLGSTPIANRNR